MTGNTSSSKPFTLIGINSDEDKDALKKVLAKRGVTWRSLVGQGQPDRTHRHHLEHPELADDLRD